MMTTPQPADIYDTMTIADQWTVPQLSHAVELRGWTCSDATALDALRDMRRGGYVTTRGKWRTDELWMRTGKVPVMRRGLYVLADEHPEPVRKARDHANVRQDSAGDVITQTIWIWCKNTQQAVAYEAHHARGCACGGAARHAPGDSVSRTQEVPHATQDDSPQAPQGSQAETGQEARR